MLGFKCDCRPRVLLAIDRPGWAFARIAARIVEHLSDEFDFVIAPQHECIDGDCDLLVAFWYGAVPLLRTDIRARRCVACLYDAYSWRRDDGGKRLGWAFARADALAVVNRRIAEDVASLHGLPVHIVEDGVDTAMFQPTSLPWRFRAGWCGNSFPPASRAAQEDLKGLRIIREACAIADVSLEVADVQDGAMIVHEHMPRWYEHISAYVCASLAEGTPNPVLEAMACGRPVISTNVGIVPDVVRDGENGWIVARTAPAFAEALATARAAPLRKMGRAARATVELWDWTFKVAAWRECFRATLAGPARCERSVLAGRAIDT